MIYSQLRMNSFEPTVSSCSLRYLSSSLLIAPPIIKAKATAKNISQNIGTSRPETIESER